MHDCKNFEVGLVDLVFDELESDEKRRRLADIESCYRCLNDYRSITHSLTAFDEAVVASLPDESYWKRHHEALRRSLSRVTHGIQAPKTFFWKRGLSARISLPVPLAAAIAVTLVVVSTVALRQKGLSPSIDTTQSSTAIARPVKTSQVPVIKERIITRTVYVDRPIKASSDGRRAASERAGQTRLLAKASGKASGDLITSANLTDYQPPDEMRIRIVKRSNSDDK